MQRLDLIFQTVHPARDTLHVYGHEIRNLLILAATEVETHWRGVLTANGSTKIRYDTRDYIHLLKPMRLDQYSIGLRDFPWLDAIKPFGKWDDAAPTQSLNWYDAYNAVKHNREAEFHKGTLEHAISAVCACIVMLAAQFTVSIGLGGRSNLSGYFRFDAMPTWAVNETYTSPPHWTDWAPLNHPDLIIS